MGDAALGDGDGSVSNLDVAADADLSGQDYVVAYVGGSGESHLGAEQRVVAMVQLWRRGLGCRSSRRVQSGFADAGAIDAGIGLKFGIALNHHIAGLDDLVPAVAVVFIRNIALFNFGETKAVEPTTTPFWSRTLSPRLQNSRTTA